MKALNIKLSVKKTFTFSKNIFRFYLRKLSEKRIFPIDYELLGEYNIKHSKNYESLSLRELFESTDFYEYTIKENLLSLYLLNDLKVSHKKGYLSKSYYLLHSSELISWSYEDVFNHLIPIFYPKNKINLKKAVVITSKSFNNYWHWHHDVLMYLTDLERYGITVRDVVINEPLLSYHKQSLGYFLSKYKFHFVNNKTLIKIEKALVLNSNYLDSNYVKSLGLRIDSFRNMFANKKITNNKKIFIDRNNHAKGRNIINYEELRSFLFEQEIEIIHLEKMNYYEQIELFQSSKLIVGPHGAGFTNVIFCGENTQIIELNHKNRVNPIFQLVSKIIGLKHTMLLSYNETIQSDPDILVNVEKLKDIINNKEFL